MEERGIVNELYCAGYGVESAQKPSKYDNELFNSLWIFVRSIGLVILWIIADWMVCTLLGGTGTLKEITVVTCYSLWPLILSNFLKIILTNVLVPNEANFLSILNAIAIIYFFVPVFSTRML